MKKKNAPNQADFLSLNLLLPQAGILQKQQHHLSVSSESFFTCSSHSFAILDPWSSLFYLWDVSQICSLFSVLIAIATVPALIIVSSLLTAFTPHFPGCHQKALSKIYT